jgi:WD40 repeat protein
MSSSLEPFSREKHLATWSEHRLSVVVKGTLYEDGDFYVIERGPARSGELLRVRRSDVVECADTGVARGSVGERQVHRVRIKRGVPIQRFALATSDDLNPGVIGIGHSVLTSRRRTLARATPNKASSLIARIPINEIIRSFDMNASATNVVVSGGETLSQWDPLTGTNYRRDPNGDGLCFKFSPVPKDWARSGGNRAAVADDVNTREFIHPDNSLIRSIQFSTNGSKFLTGANDGTARLWNTWPDQAVNRVPLVYFNYPYNSVYWATITPDERFVAVSGTGPIILYDAQTGAKISEARGTISLRSITPDNRHLVAVTDAGISVLSIPNLKLERTIALPPGYSSAACPALSGDGMILAACGHAGRQSAVLVWDFPSGQLYPSFDGSVSGNLEGWEMSVSHDGRYVAASTFEPYEIWIWRVY